MRNHHRSTPARCRTMPCRDRVEGGTDRSDSRSGGAPVHLSSKVARCQSRKELSISSSSPVRGGEVRGSGYQTPEENCGAGVPLMAVSASIAPVGGCLNPATWRRQTARVLAGGRACYVARERRCVGGRCDI